MDWKLGCTNYPAAAVIPSQHMLVWVTSIEHYINWGLAFYYSQHRTDMASQDIPKILNLPIVSLSWEVIWIKKAAQLLEEKPQLKMFSFRVTWICYINLVTWLSHRYALLCSSGMMRAMLDFSYTFKPMNWISAVWMTFLWSILFIKVNDWQNTKLPDCQSPISSPLGYLCGHPARYDGRLPIPHFVWIA